MDKFSDLITAVQSDLTVDSTSPLYSPDVIKLAINRAYRKAGALYRWPETDDAKKTSTIANQEYYDYPDNWRPNTIWKLTVDGTDYGQPLVFRDYLYEKENSIPSGKSNLWANQRTRFFIYPTPTTSGSFNISVWGQKVVDKLVNDSDTTIFSYAMPECNEAVVLEAVAILKSKGDEVPVVSTRYVTGLLLFSIEAQQILTQSWNKIREELDKYKKTRPFFDVPDFFGRGGTKQNTGKFD